MDFWENLVLGGESLVLGLIKSKANHSNTNLRSLSLQNKRAIKNLKDVLQAAVLN